MSIPIRCHSPNKWIVVGVMIFMGVGCADRSGTNQKMRQDSFFRRVDEAWKYVKMDCGLQANSTLADLRLALTDLNHDVAVDFSLLNPDELLLASVVGIRLGDDMRQLTLSKDRKGESRMHLIEYSEEIQRYFVRDFDKNGFPSFYLSDRTGKITLTSDLLLAVE
jgi:hypothetical protein